MSQFPPTMPPGPAPSQPHRGPAVLVLGILSLVIGCIGWVFGIIAVVMANRDLREMNEGVMDPTGRGLTQAGRICAIISLALHAMGLVFFLFWVVVAGGLAASGSPMGSP